MQDVTINLNELIMGVATLLSGGGLGTVIAKYKGWVTFGKPTERRRCPDSVKQVCNEHNQMVVDISKLTAEMVDVKQQSGENNRLLHSVNSKVDQLVGYQKGKNGVNLG